MQIRAFLFPKSTQSPTALFPPEQFPLLAMRGAPRALYTPGIARGAGTRGIAWKSAFLHRMGSRSSSPRRGTAHIPPLRGTSRAEPVPVPIPIPGARPPLSPAGPGWTGLGWAGMGGHRSPEPPEPPEPPGPPPARPGRALLAPQPAGRCSSVVL